MSDEALVGNELPSPAEWGEGWDKPCGISKGGKTVPEKGVLEAKVGNEVSPLEECTVC